MNYLPFDLEAALKNPERVITKDGIEVKGFRDTRPFGNNSQYIFDGFIEGKYDAWTLEFAEEILRLKAEVIELTVYVYRVNSNGNIWASNSKPDELLLSNHHTHIATQTIKVEI